MKDFDIFESYKSNIRYPLVAELKTVNLKPVISYDKNKLFENPYIKDWQLMLPWKTRSIKLDYGFLHGIFFMNGILIEEHHLSLPPLNDEGVIFWWGHYHLRRLLKGLNVKFYGR